MSDPSDDRPGVEKNHEVGDTKMVSALSLPREDARDEHEIELYAPPASIGVGLKWKCERCWNIFADWTLFESEPCLPWDRTQPSDPTQNPDGDASE